LSSKDGQQKKQKDSDFEVIGMRRSNLGEIIETPGEQNGAADHSRDFEIGQALVIEHPVKFQQSDHSEHADQQPKQYLVTGEHDQQSDCPKRNCADESQNESRAGRKDVRPGLLKSHGHAIASFLRNESGASQDERLPNGATDFLPSNLSYYCPRNTPCPQQLRAAMRAWRNNAKSFRQSI
jgi:hypothetical protein